MGRTPRSSPCGRRAAGPGATAVVTLEPCNHTGRTGPCTAPSSTPGIGRAIVAVRDPWAPAAGGIDVLRAAGVDVVDLSSRRTACRPITGRPVTCRPVKWWPIWWRPMDVNRVWLTATTERRPFVTWKAGMTVDGRVAAADGTSRWISSAASRADSTCSARGWTP